MKQGDKVTITISDKPPNTGIRTKIVGMIEGDVMKGNISVIDVPDERLDFVARRIK